jgi:hypothetical protein
MLFEDIIIPYSDNLMKSINTHCRQTTEVLNVKAGGKYCYHWVLK